MNDWVRYAEKEVICAKAMLVQAIHIEETIQIIRQSRDIERMLTVAAREVPGEKKINFKFKAKAFPTGKYTLKINGEAFNAEQKFFILN